MLREITLKTRMNTAARKDKKASFLKLLRIALKIFVNYDISVKISKRWIVYHSTPTKLPIIVAVTNIKIDRKPDSYCDKAYAVTKVFLMIKLFITAYLNLLK